MQMRVLVDLFLTFTMVNCLNGRRTTQMLMHAETASRTLESRLREEVEDLQRVTSHFSKLSSQSAVGSRDDYVTSPLPALVMIRRLVEDWTALAGMARQGLGLVYLGLEAVRWPTPYHVSLAAYAVMRSQMTYDLNTQAQADGGIPGVDVSFNVTAADCFYVGKTFLENKNINEALQWFYQALLKTNVEDISASPQANVYFWIILSCYSGNPRIKEYSLDLVNNILEGKLFTSYTYHLESYRELAENYCVESRDKLEDANQQFKDSLGFWSTTEAMEQHRRLCRGQGGSHRSLRCRYLHHNLHHLRLRPFKLEELHLDPPVLRFYDVITDHESHELQRFALKDMETAAFSNEGTSQSGRYRTSHVGWILPGQSALHDRVCRRMEDMTQLDMRLAEDSQLTRYSVSGEYLTHCDHGNFQFLEDRIATLMFYLNDVKSGGYTIFPKLNVSVEPIKNSAILWFNFLPSGDKDPLSEHSGCPVLHGTKWVLVKWFLNEGQEFKKRCGLSKNDSFKRYYEELSQG